MRKTRSQPNNDVDTKSTLQKVAPATKKVFFVPESLKSTMKDGWQLEYLHHPGTGKRALFLTSSDQMLEVLKFDEPRRSWLIGSEICCNGRIYMTVPIDSTFLALHYLRKYCTERAMALDSIRDEDGSAARLLTRFVRESSVSSAADVKNVGDANYFKFNREKTIAWLAVKTRRVALALRSIGVYCGHSAKSQNYTRSEKIIDEADRMDDTEFMRMACDIVGNYVDIELHDELSKYLKIPSETEAKAEEKKSNAAKRKTTQQLNGSNSKKVKTSLLDEESEEEEKVDKVDGISTPTMAKERALSTKEKALAKSAKGTKSISSFFKK